MDKTKSLTDIEKDIIEQNICSKLAQTATQLVMGDGNPDADIVMIGEAPGKNEDIQGKPFVGAAGKFLDEMLASIGRNRQDIFITNIVKYRPPDNRDPSDQEKSEFFPFLERQLKVINPKLIVTLGRHSGMAFLPGLRIGRDHGQPKKLNGKVILPLYHPAAALYNGGMRQTLLDDFARVPIILRKIDQVIKEGKNE